MPRSTVVLRRLLAVAELFTLAAPATFAQSMRTRERADATARATAELAMLHAESDHRISMPPTGDTREQLELAPAAGARP